MKRKISTVLIGVLLCSIFISGVPVAMAADQAELDDAAGFLREQGVMVGDQNGNMNFDAKLNRSHLAAILTRISVNPEHVAADQEFYIRQCSFLDVPEWAKLYVGVCYAHGLMVGYDNGLFGAEDGVTPAAACTVVLRYLDLPDIEWDYSTAAQTALELNLITEEAVQKAELTRGDLAIILYRALDGGVTGVPSQSTGNSGLTRNADGSINIPSDGSRYVPQTGDVIRCDDGTNYTIVNISQYNKSMFASGPIGDLPAPTCDWSLLPQPELPAVEARHFTVDGKEYLFLRNLYETKRMLYTLYNAIGNNPETWQNGAPVLTTGGNLKVRINLSIAADLNPQSIWPWRENQIVDLFNSCPPGTYSMEAWDVFSDGIFQRTEYDIHVV